MALNKVVATVKPEYKGQLNIRSRATLLTTITGQYLVLANETLTAKRWGTTRYGQGNIDSFLEELKLREGDHFDIETFND
jgi:hypothetical protein